MPQYQKLPTSKPPRRKKRKRFGRQVLETMKAMKRGRRGGY